MRLRHVALFFALAVLLFILFAEIAAQGTTVKGARLLQVAASSGQEMYIAYCAECHGRDGKGGKAHAATYGPAAPDLTILSRANHGRFPIGAVRSAIRGESHGSAYRPGEMPPWGHLFQYLGSGSRLEVDVRIGRLADYLQTLQEK